MTALLRFACHLALCCALPLLVAGEVAAQTIHGRVIDAETGRPIAGASIEASSGDTRFGIVVSDSTGTFVFALKRMGTYRLRARMIGYRGVDSLVVEVGLRDLVDVTVRMSTSAVPLDPITVNVNVLDPRHRATWDGFLMRHAILPPIGNRRAVLREDAEMVNAMYVQDVLNWFPPRFCTVIYLNGRIFGGGLLDIPVSHFEGMEFYRYGFEAPLEMRDPGNCAFASKWSVLAFWMHRTAADPMDETDVPAAVPPLRMRRR
jgi:hypothetical protein